MQPQTTIHAPKTVLPRQETRFKEPSSSCRVMQHASSDGPTKPSKAARNGTGGPENSAMLIVDEPIAAGSALRRCKNKGLFFGEVGIEMDIFVVSAGLHQGHGLLDRWQTPVII